MSRRSYLYRWLLAVLVLAAGTVSAQQHRARPHPKASQQPEQDVMKAKPAPTPATMEAVDTLQGQPVYAYAEPMPTFPGGTEALRALLLRQLRYPPQYTRTHIEGSIFISFIIDHDGQVWCPTLVKGIGEYCDEEALRVVRQLPRFVPGRRAGQAVAVRYVLPLRFACTEGWSFGPTGRRR